MADEAAAPPLMHIVYSNGDEFVGECQERRSQFLKHGKGLLKSAPRAAPSTSTVKSAVIASLNTIASRQVPHAGDVYDGSWP